MQLEGRHHPAAAVALNPRPVEGAEPVIAPGTGVEPPWAQVSFNTSVVRALKCFHTITLSPHRLIISDDELKQSHTAQKALLSRAARDGHGQVSADRGLHRFALACQRCERAHVVGMPQLTLDSKACRCAAQWPTPSIAAALQTATTLLSLAGHPCLPWHAYRMEKPLALGPVPHQRYAARMPLSSDTCGSGTVPLAAHGWHHTRHMFIHRQALPSIHQNEQPEVAYGLRGRPSQQARSCAEEREGGGG